MPPEAVPSNASVASTGLGLRYIGDHCYAYSGLYGASTTGQTVLDFTTGAGVIVATFQLNGNVDATGGGFVAAWSMVTFNGINIALLKTASSAEDSPTTATVRLVIPPLTHVQAAIDSASDSGSAYGSLILTGRVYE